MLRRACSPCRRAQSTVSARGGFSRGAVGMSGFGAKSSTLSGYGSASVFDVGDDHRLGHRQIGRHRLRCCPQQDVPLAHSRLASEPLAKQDQGLGQW